MGRGDGSHHTRHGSGDPGGRRRRLPPMKTLRTPDQRFVGLPGYDFAPTYADDRRLRGRDAAGPLRARGGSVGAGRALDARRTLLVLPLPYDDPRPDRGGPADRGTRPGRLRALGQANRALRLHVRPPRGMDARAPLRQARPARRHAGVPGLGWAHRPAPGRRAPRPLRPGRGGQHVPSHRGQRPGGGLLRLAALLARGRRIPHRCHRRGRLRQAHASRRAGSVRRAASPTSPTRPGHDSSRCWCPRGPTTRPTTPTWPPG